MKNHIIVTVFDVDEERSRKMEGDTYKQIRGESNFVAK